MADIFDVIADPTRRDILRVLLDRSSDDAHAVGEIIVSEIVATLELSQPTVSKHLKVLREAGLVAVREEGQHRYYRLDSEPLEAVEDWVIPFTASEDDVGAQRPSRRGDARIREHRRQGARRHPPPGDSSATRRGSPRRSPRRKRLIPRHRVR